MIDSFLIIVCLEKEPDHQIIVSSTSRAFFKNVLNRKVAGQNCTKHGDFCVKNAVRAVNGSR